MASGSSSPITFLQAIIYIFTQPPIIACLFTASTTLALSAYRALSVDPPQKRSRNGANGTSASQAEIHQMPAIESSTALLFPLLASLSLLFMFYFFHSISFILNLLSFMTGSMAIFFVLSPIVDSLTKRFIRTSSIRIMFWGDIGISTLIISILIAFIMLMWIFTGHWLINNIIGISFCFLFTSLIRAPSLKIIFILLAGLFVYDIFWVFFSARFFGKNVMVDVATKESPNPASVIADAFHLPLSPVKNLPLPAKLMFPAVFGTSSTYIMLGLGDIVIPSIFVAFVLRFDTVSASEFKDGYFLKSFVGYVLGLMISFFCNIYFRAAQPALLHLVPCICIPVTIAAIIKGDWDKLWTGSFQEWSPLVADDLVPDRADQV